MSSETVSDERLASLVAAIKADCSHGSRVWNLADQIETTLIEQSLRSKPVASGVDVKPLEWVQNTKQSVYGENSYTATPIRDLRFVIGKLNTNEAWSYKGRAYATIEEAKAAAEADYRQRILSALSLPAQEPVSFEGLPKRKLDDLVGRGWEVVGYALQNGEQRYGFITTGGFVGWWLPEDYPLHTSGEPPQPEAVITATHRHKKRGTEYVLIGIGKMQAEHWWTRAVDHHGRASPAPVDMREVAIYRSATDPNEIWVRPREEFEDGRFEILTAALKEA